MRFRSHGASTPTPAPLEVATAAPAASKRAFALCFAPLLLLGAASVCSAIARHASPKKPPVLSAPIPVSALNQTPTGTRTRRAANAFLGRVLGNHATVARATILGDQSLRSTARAGAWSVLCDTSEGYYLLLINAKTRQVYAINHVEETNLSTDYAPADEKGSVEDTTLEEEGASLSRDAAKGQALHYLRLVGIASRNLKTAPSVRDSGKRHPEPCATRVYNFAFTDSHHPEQPIMVVVNSKDGHLQSLWRPVETI